ncbi:MAG: hypothetical protein GY820_25800, partial [Gammaproteobacteria bacterium]|nr:hypothetical protein [Gammaproteobacteria bacterium]
AYQQQQAPGNVPAGAATQHYPATQNSGPANVSPAAGTTSPSNGQQQPAQAHNFLPQQ